MSPWPAPDPLGWRIIPVKRVVRRRSVVVWHVRYMPGFVDLDEALRAEHRSRAR